MTEFCNLPRLRTCCLRRLVKLPAYLGSVLDRCLLPIALYKDLLVEAIYVSDSDQLSASAAIPAMVSRWPHEDLLVEGMVKGIPMAADKKDGAIFFIVEGLLNTKPCSMLRTVDFLGVHCHDAFLLPILTLATGPACHRRVLDLIHKQFAKFLPDGKSCAESLEAISWVFTERFEKSRTYHFQGKEPISVLLETQVSLTDWITMGDEMLGLLLQDLGPFRLRMRRLALDNFSLTQAPHFRLLMLVVDPEDLEFFGIYGHRKSVWLSMWEFRNELCRLRNLQKFAAATIGPRLLRDFHSTGPSVDEVLEAHRLVFSSWKNLSELILRRVTLTNRLAILLGALERPLKKLFLYCNNLSESDVTYLSSCHHIPSLEGLHLEKMDLSPWADAVLSMIGRTECLETLVLRDTYLQEQDKLALMAILLPAPSLKEFVLYESESMLTVSGYHDLVRSAVLMPALRRFFVFPFQYPPFDQFYRSEVRKICEDVLTQADREDMCLFY